MELKHLSFDLEVKADDAARTVEGFASVYNNVDSHSDIVMPGAFTKTLKTRMPAMLWQHNTEQPIGVWEDFMEQEKGLFIKGTILPTQLGNDAYTLAKAKAIKGMSIGYSPVKWEFDDKKGLRKLTEVELYEVSLVTFPANEKASITRVKSAPDNERDFENLLREAGYPREAAKIIIARGFKALSGQREAEEQEQNQVAEILGQFAQRFNQ